MDDVETLVMAVLTGDVTAWQRLVEVLVPRIEAVAGSQRGMRRRFGRARKPARRATQRLDAEQTRAGR
jgi:hypothetical protein